MDEKDFESIQTEPSSQKEDEFHCDICTYSLRVPREESWHNIHCEQCGKTHHLRPKSSQLTLIFAMTALVFYFPANLFPFMTIELYGNRNSSTIWGGITSLADSGSWFLAVIVFLASILIPFIKLLILFFLSVTSSDPKHKKFKTKLYHIVEAIGRWSMLDIFLLAVLVAMMKLGHWTSVQPEIGSALFALVVIFTLLSSAFFDPKLIWKDKHEKNN
jgi:paraquat-inducible protein A